MHEGPIYRYTTVSAVVFSFRHECEARVSKTFNPGDLSVMKKSPKNVASELSYCVFYRLLAANLNPAQILHTGLLIYNLKTLFENFYVKAIAGFYKATRTRFLSKILLSRLFNLTIPHK